MNERDPRRAFSEWWKSLEGEQRFALSIFGFCAILSVGLSIAYMRSGILSPFLVSKETLKASQTILSQQNAQDQNLTDLKAKDTDRDGLSDYAEIYLYKTSPYLADTDSDGILDAIEIAQGTNPNCPEGTNCAQLVDTAPNGTSTSTYQDLLNTTPVDSVAGAALGATDPGVIGAQNFIQTAPDPSTLSIDQVRNILTTNNLVAGTSLDGIPDDQVLQIYTAAYDQVQKIRDAQKKTASQAPATGQIPIAQ